MNNKLLKNTFDKILTYLDQIETSNNYLNQYKSPNNLLDKIDISIIDNENKKILPLIDDYLEYSIKTGSKHFFNQLFGGVNIPAIIGEFITTITNTSMYTYEVAPLATMIEKELINEFSNLIGYKKSEGIFVTGGSNSNLLALLIAQYKKDNDFKLCGNQQNNQVFFVSEDSHYSYDKAAIILGIGLNNIIKVKTNSEGSMIPEELEKSINEQIKNNKDPFFVGLTSGTTVKGAFDPIVDIIKICTKYNLWSHVDGSWGGPLLFSNSKKYLLRGSEKADSFSIDAHKMLGVPLICSAIMFKEKGLLYKLNNISGMEYLLKEEEDININLGNFSLQCGRRVDALKLWLTFKYYGRNGIKNRIEHLLKIATYASEKIIKDKNLKLISPFISLNLCFIIFDSKDNVELSNNRIDYIRKKLLLNTTYLINTAIINNQKCFRLIIVNPDLNTRDIDILFNTIKTIAKSFNTKK